MRKTSKRMYLGAQLNTTKMHQLYQEHYKDTQASGSLSTYRYVFNTEYNFSFFQPKKDQCLDCTSYQQKTNPTDIETEKYNDHISQKDRAQSEKKSDKEKAIAAQDLTQSQKFDKETITGPTILSFTFDLQSVLYTPCSDVSSLFYSRKLSFYNFTTYNLANREGMCYMWDECNGKRGACEIGTCMYMHLMNVSPTVKHVILYCDSCGGQNRNQYMMGTLKKVVSDSKIETIDLKFLVRGHTQMEVDSMHGSIETAKKHATVFVPSDWYNIVRLARRNKPYIIIPLTYGSFLDFKSYMSDCNTKVDSVGKQVKWNSIRWIRLEKSNLSVFKVKYNFDDDVFTIVPLKKTRKTRRSQQDEVVLPNQAPQLYHHLLPISSEKKKDLRRLCESEVIPSLYHRFYNELPCEETITDRLPEPDIQESDSEEDV